MHAWSRLALLLAAQNVSQHASVEYPTVEFASMRSRPIVQAKSGALALPAHVATQPAVAKSVPLQAAHSVAPTNEVCRKGHVEHTLLPGWLA